MPKHPDFQKIYTQMIKKHGKEKGKEVYYSWLNKNKLDDTKPMPKKMKGEQMGNFDVSYFASIQDIEIVAEEREVAGEKKKIKKAILSGKLMDDKPNLNFWKAHKPSFPVYAESIGSAAAKVQHDYDDWKIIGSGLEGKVEGDSIMYKLEIVNPEAVSKFETGEWNARVMGVSPQIRSFTGAECSLCGKDVRTCGHTMGVKYKEYNGKTCIVTPIGGYVGEISLTSTPAYFPRAGTIDSMSFAASLKESLNIEEIDMTETDFEAKMKEMEEKVDKLSAQLDEKVQKIEQLEKKLKAEEDDDSQPAEPSEPEGKPEEPEGDGAEASNEESDDGQDEEAQEALKAMQKERDFIKAELTKIKNKARKAELAKVTDNEKIVASVIKKDLSDEDFEAELEFLKEMKAQNAGSAPIEGQNKQTDPDKEFEAEWGCSKKEFVRSLVAGNDQHDSIQAMLEGD